MIAYLPAFKVFFIQGEVAWGPLRHERDQRETWEMCETILSSAKIALKCIGR